MALKLTKKERGEKEGRLNNIRFIRSSFSSTFVFQLVFQLYNLFRLKHATTVPLSCLSFTSLQVGKHYLIINSRNEGFLLACVHCLFGCSVSHHFRFINIVIKKEINLNWWIMRGAVEPKDGFYVIAHMTNTPEAVSWAVGEGANSVCFFLCFFIYYLLVWRYMHMHIL